MPSGRYPLKAVNDMSTLEQLQNWFNMHCDNDWEHDERVRIRNLDNPGWRVELDVSSTLLENAAFAPVKHGDPEQREGDWIDCEVKDAVFIGMGSWNMLERLLLIFLRWAEDNTDTSAWDGEVKELLHQLKQNNTVDELRTFYRRIDDIPPEHPQKAKLAKSFTAVWNKLVT